MDESQYLCDFTAYKYLNTFKYLDTITEMNAGILNFITP
jgi:hypothetical protein